MSIESTNESISYVLPPADLNLLAQSDPKTLYIVYDGTKENPVLASKVLNSDGSVHNDGTNDFSLTGVAGTNGTATWDKTKLWIPADVVRWTGANYYAVGLWQYDTMRTGLDRKLAQWGQQARRGFKSGVDL